MTTIAIDASELIALGQRFVGAEPVIEREFETAMVRSTAAVQHDAMVAAPVDTGTLRRSITTDVTPFLGSVGSNLPYAPVVEFGREAGKTMPPSGALEPWMRRHGITVAEFVIRRSIGRRGTPARPYFVPALERNRAGIEREFDLAVARALKRLAG
jgi:phage gpG-like protein